MARLLPALLLCALGAGAARADAPRLSVMTYNVNYATAGDATIVAAIAEGDADVVLLQETTPAWEKALRGRLGARYPHILFRHFHRSPGGLGVLSKHPVVEKDYLPAPSGWFPAWRLEVEAPLGAVQVLNVHLRPNVDGHSWIKGWFTTRGIRRREMASYVAKLDPKLPTVVAGDFNEELDGRAVRLLAARGFTSAVEPFAPGAATWHMPNRKDGLRLQLDHILCDGRLVPISAGILDRGGSDHFPVIAVLRLRP
jgi:endonuclease/exonuclease/phosphatase (EEP) superfamily protein YafD